MGIVRRSLRFGLGISALLLGAAALPSQAATLYGSTYSGSDGVATLQRIDPSTGAAVAIGSTGFQRVSGIDFGPDGRLYGAGERNDGSDTSVLIAIDTATGAGFEIGPLGLPPGQHVTDLSFRPSDGRLYAFLDVPDQVATIDLATGAATILGAPGPSGGGNGLAFSANVSLYHAESGGLYVTNQATGGDTFVSGYTYVGFPPPTAFYRVNALDRDPSSGRLLASVNDGGLGNLATLDPATGVVRFVAATAGGLDGLAWEPDRCRVALYGAAHVGGAGPSTLYRIDPVSGASGAIGPIGFASVSGIDFHPSNGTLYGVGRRISDGVAVLLRIDPFTGAGGEVGPLVNAPPAGGGGLYDLSFLADGTLLLASRDAGGAVVAYRVSLANGLATPLPGLVAPLNGGNALGTSIDGTVFHSNPSVPLSYVDPGTGVGTPIGALAFAGFPALLNPRLSAMDFDPSTGAAWAVVNDGVGGAGPQYLAVLETRAQRVRHVAPAVVGLDAIAWRVFCEDGDPCTEDTCTRCEDSALVGSQYAGPDGLATLYRVDPSSGAAAAIGPIGFERVSALDYDEETGVLYGLGERADGSNVSVLIAIDPVTGAGAEIGPTGIAGLGFNATPDASIRNRDGVLYVYLDLGDAVGTADKTTGAVTLLGPSNVPGFGNGMAFSRSDVLHLADGTNMSTLDQTTGAATAGPLLSYVGFPNPGANFRVAAMDTSCSGRVLGTVFEGGGGAPTSYLARVDTASGVVTQIGSTVGGLDGIAWLSTRGQCRSVFVDSDADLVCDFFDCAPLDATAFAIPDEVFIVGSSKVDPITANYNFSGLTGGSGSTYDTVADLTVNLPVGPGGGTEIFLCGHLFNPIGLSGNPASGQVVWIVTRGRNACGAGTYGNTHTNPGPPLNGPARVTTSCP